LPGLLEDILLMIRRQTYFQHDGAPPLYTNGVRELLNEFFPNRWVGPGGPVFWPPRSQDLKTLDYYFWRVVISVVCSEGGKNFAKNKRTPTTFPVT